MAEFMDLESRTGKQQVQAAHSKTQLQAIEVPTTYIQEAKDNDRVCDENQNTGNGLFHWCRFGISTHRRFIDSPRQLSHR